MLYMYYYDIKILTYNTSSVIQDFSHRAHPQLGGYDIISQEGRKEGSYAGLWCNLPVSAVVIVVVPAVTAQSQRQPAEPES